MELLLYLAKASIYAAVMWGIYMVVWRNSSLHRYSRIYLLLSLVVPLILPFIHLATATQSPIAAHAVSLPLVTTSAEQTSIPTEPSVSTSRFLLAYVSVSVFIALVYIRSYCVIYYKLRKSKLSMYGGHKILTHTGIGPGSLGKKIFFPSAEVKDIIVKHELAHIRYLHRYDSLLLQAIHIFFWISPAHWLLGRELKMVHEFEADSTACHDVATSDYIAVLLSHVLGSTVPSNITHSFFHHPLKRRVMMLQKSNASPVGRLLFAATILTAAFTGTILLAQAKEPTERDLTAGPDTTLTAPATQRYTQIQLQDAKVRLLPAGGFAYVRVQQMPRFEGDLTEWLKANIHYPESARTSGLSGLCTIQFTVDENGSIINPSVLQSSKHAALDAEAMRVIKAMPQWQPGYHQGHAVPVLFSQAFFFTADGKVDARQGC